MGWFQEKVQGSTFGADIPATIKKGSTGAAVKQWQSAIGINPADGNFGSGTDTKTKAWQSAHGLAADGVVGAKSWAMVLGAPPPAQAAAQAANPPVAPVAVQVAVQHATIRRNSTGADVKEWQGVLGIAQDGVFGAGTEAKTKAFQTSAGLNPDGVVGPQTWMVAHVAHASMPVPVTTSSGTVYTTPTPAKVVATTPLRVVDPSGEFPPATRPAPQPLPQALKAVIIKGIKPSVQASKVTPISASGQQVVNAAAGAMTTTQVKTKEPWYLSLPAKIAGGVAVLFVGAKVVTGGKKHHVHH